MTPRALSLLPRVRRFHRFGIGASGRGRGSANARAKIVIEGFLHTGNTYAFAAFHIANRKIRIAGRLHAPANVRLAVRLRKPTIVLIRPPADTAVSFANRMPDVTVRQALSEYIEFYRNVAPMQSRFLLAEFDQVVSDFGSVIR
ncbi:MAG: hypothetical protein ACRD1T_24310, partial [Acidimicrobiia bacterium]